MAVPPMSPGSMLDGRYRLEDLLAEHDGARFWRATDTVLARSVAVHIVPSDDPRAPAVLEAARSSARVTDPHFLRVLDCDDADGLTWVINEWGDGTSLDIMLSRGTLPAMRAAWLTREVAEAIVSAHKQGLYHGRLNPEAVLVTTSGAVKLIGFLVSAAFERTPASTSGYGAISPREADVVDLAGVLYASLTGRWPGVAPSAVPPAPREGNRPLRPRQVRAGVPRTLDAICDRVLNKEAFAHAMPIETAHEVAAALIDFVGDPALVAPVDAPSMHSEPQVPEDPELEAALAAELAALDVEPEDVEPVEAPAVPAASPPLAVPLVVEDLEPEPEPYDAPATDEEPPPPVPPRPPARPAARPAGPTNPPAPGVGPADDLEATMASPPPFSPSGIEFLEPEDWTPSAPPPPFEQPAERPLFADQERRVPADAPSRSAPTPPAGTGSWPFADDAPAPPYVAPRKRRTWLKVLLILLVVVAVGVAMYLAFIAGKGDDQPGATSSTAPTSTLPTPSETPTLTGTIVPITAAGDFDPEGDPPSENPGRVRRAIDGNPDTAWPTSTYTQANLGGLKSGVGIVVDLGSEKTITSVQVQLLGSPTDVELYATDPGVENAPAELADTTRIGRVAGAGATAAVQLTGVRTRYVVVWLTKLPAVEGGFQGQIAEITVRS